MGLDFIGEIHPSSSGQHKWILTATDYFTKWIEAIPCRGSLVSHSTAYYPQDRLSTKKSIGMSPYELVYGMEAKFPSSLGIPTIKILQEIQAQPNDMQRRVNQTIHLQQTREHVYDRAQMLQEKLKRMFDKKAKVEDFWVGSKVLRWDS
eukprot:PITA_10005